MYNSEEAIKKARKCFLRALDISISAGYVSTSLLECRLYPIDRNVSENIIGIMERYGLIGPQVGRRPRSINEQQAALFLGRAARPGMGMDEFDLVLLDCLHGYIAPSNLILYENFVRSDKPDRRLGPLGIFGFKCFAFACYILSIPWMKMEGHFIRIYGEQDGIDRRNLIDAVKVLYGMQDIINYVEVRDSMYQVSATLDSVTCEKCGSMDRCSFKVKDAVVGENFPPFHEGCRCTTVRYIDEESIKSWQRSARDPKTGKSILVPYGMNYEEWKKKYSG